MNGVQLFGDIGNSVRVGEARAGVEKRGDVECQGGELGTGLCVGGVDKRPSGVPGERFAG